MFIFCKCICIFIYQLICLNDMDRPEQDNVFFFFFIFGNSQANFGNPGQLVSNVCKSYWAIVFILIILTLRSFSWRGFGCRLRAGWPWARCVICLCSGVRPCNLERHRLLKGSLGRSERKVLHAVPGTSCSWTERWLSEAPLKRAICSQVSEHSRCFIKPELLPCSWGRI